MHLKQLTIKNFKSHADSVVNFGDVTSITGKNNSGKTNIIRALKVLLHHGDWPASWIRYGQDSASIELVLVDGTKVTRKRTKTAQSVIIETAGKIETYEGKKDATEFIEKAVGICKITLDEATGPEDLNFVEVNEGPYLLGGRSDTVQRKVAGIVGANGIDDAKSRILKRHKDLDNQSKTLNNNIAELTSTVTTARTSLNSIQEILKDAQDLQQQWDNNQTKFETLDNFSNHISTLSSLIPTNIVVKKLTDLHAKTQKQSKSFQDLHKKVAELKEVEGKLQKYKANVKNATKLHDLYKEVEKLKSDLSTKTSTISDLNTYSTDFQGLKDSIDLQSAELKTISTELKTSSKEKIKMLKELGVCPVCGKKI